MADDKNIAWTERNAGGVWSLTAECGKYTARIWEFSIYGQRVYRWDVSDGTYSYAAAQASSIEDAKRMSSRYLRELSES